MCWNSTSCVGVSVVFEKNGCLQPRKNSRWIRMDWASGEQNADSFAPRPWWRRFKRKKIWVRQRLEAHTGKPLLQDTFPFWEWVRRTSQEYSSRISGGLLQSLTNYYHRFQLHTSMLNMCLIFHWTCSSAVTKAQNNMVILTEKFHSSAIFNDK